MAHHGPRTCPAAGLIARSHRPPGSGRVAATSWHVGSRFLRGPAPVAPGPPVAWRCDGEPAWWPRSGAAPAVTGSRKVGAPQGKGAGESQDGATCRIRATESRPPMAPERSGAQARVKRCGKSAPAPGATPAARQPPPGARSNRGRAGPATSPQVDRTDGWPPIRNSRKGPGGQNPAYKPAHHRTPPADQGKHPAQGPENGPNPTRTAQARGARGRSASGLALPVGTHRGRRPGRPASKGPRRRRSRWRAGPALFDELPLSRVGQPVKVGCALAGTAARGASVTGGGGWMAVIGGSVTGGSVTGVGSTLVVHSTVEIEANPSSPASM
jgi:hypothetical protein